MHVVVLAYGPAQITKRAVSRARKLAGKSGAVVVVGASPAGRPALRNLSNVETIENIGGEGLRDALNALPTEPTLLIHDDVVLTPRSGAALRRELETGTRYAVPYTNDRGVDHFLRSLPAERAAERNLDQIATPRESRPAATVRSGCVLAMTNDLAKLLSEPLVDPFVVLDGARHGFTVAGSALASHSTRCLGRTIQDDPDGRPLLVAALIVRDEEEMLPGCLESLAPLVDRIEICDTGSTDATIAIARAAGAHVIEREWPNDFGIARNYVLEQSRDARYILQIDADERVECPDPDRMRSFLATYSAEHPALSVEITNIDAEGADMNRFTNVRLFHATGTEFRGAVHEAVFRIGNESPLVGDQFAHIRIIHQGYAKRIVTEKHKVRRNLDLAEAEYRENPGPRSAIHLARSLSYADESPHQALALLEEAWVEAADADPTAQAQILGLMADRHVALGDDERAFELSRQAVMLVPADDTAAALLATTAERLGRFEDLIEVAESIAGRPSARPVQNVDGNRGIFRSTLATAYAHTGDSEKAVAETFDVLSEYPETFESWPPLVDCLRAGYGEAAVELLAPLATKDPNGGFLEPLIKTFPSATLAEFCVHYQAAGGTIPEVTRVGLLAAAMSGHDEAFARLAPSASSLEPLVRVGLADRISSNGRADLAELISTEPVVLRL